MMGSVEKAISAESDCHIKHHRVSPDRPTAITIPTKYNIMNEERSEKQLKKVPEYLKELYKCEECGKHFGHRQILNLHLQVHRANVKSMKQSAPTEDQTIVDVKTIVLNKYVFPAVVNDETLKEKVTGNTLSVKKVVGLTKHRFEDYLRCDACSCIYLDEVDYHKHMKNFHNQNASKRKKRIPRKKQCRSCCKNCKCTASNGNHQEIRINHLDDKINYTLHCNIQDRWSKLMEGTRTNVSNSPPEIKSEPVDDAEESLDYSHLLSQVEVRIKTEPQDELEYDGQYRE